MARKETATPANKEVEVDTSAIAGDFQVASQLATITQGYTDERDLVNQLLGQAQMASAFSDFSALVRTSKLAYVKENKLYQRLKGMMTPNGSVFSGTWEEFCRLLGRSVDMVDLDITNMRAFGEDALESMSRMGIGYREMRQYRKLPEDQKLALIEAAKGGDKDSFLDLAEEIIARHAKEKEAQTKELEEAKAEKQATDQLLESKNKRIDQLERANQRIQTLPANEAAAALREEATKYLFETQAIVQGRLRAALEALNDAPDEEGKAQFMAGMVGQVIADLVKLRDEFNLPDVLGDSRPEWQQWADKEAAQNGAAAAN
ncbi:MAG: hypothetical protein RSD57_14630 [Comamonas sp.]